MIIDDNNKERKEAIMKRMREHYSAVENMGYEIVGLFLQGSQNYNLDYSGSDIDTKAIVLPSFEDFCMNKKTVSFTHIMENNEHVDIKDIRIMFDIFKKQNINFVEILFTDFFIINPKYKDEFLWVMIFAEEIGRYNIKTALNCMYNMQLEKRKSLTNSSPSTEWKIDKWGYDGKQLHHILRIKDFMKKYISGCKYSECLIPDYDTQVYLVDVKKNEVYSSAEACRIADEICLECKLLKDDYINNTLVHNEKNEIFVNNMILDVITKIMKVYFKSVILNNESD